MSNVDIINDEVIITAGNGYWATLSLDEATDSAYKILLETQSIEQVMNRIQSDIDDKIEREHGTRTV